MADAQSIHFPFVAQVVRLDRRRELKNRCTWDTAFYVTSLSVEQADEKRLGTLIRGHWSIENRLHYRRDWSFDEDRHTSRNVVGVQAMACLRNVTIAWAARPDVQKSRRPRRATLPQLMKANARDLNRALDIVLQPWPLN